MRFCSAPKSLITDVQQASSPPLRNHPASSARPTAAETNPLDPDLDQGHKRNSGAFITSEQDVR
jgi:hypothetical protein